MKIFLYWTIAFSLIFFNIKAQCVGCTINITGPSSVQYIVNAGQNLCISPSGTINGIIAVNGGTLCNEGNINNAKVVISNFGYFVNHGMADVDTLFVLQGGKYENYGTTTNLRYITSSSATSKNYSNVVTNYIGCDSLGMVQNWGNITVNTDLYNTGNSNIVNYSYMKLNGNFYNYSSSNFYTTCKIDVSNDWYNTASVIGSSGCAGFNIGGFSSNTGTVGVMASMKIDICDVGSPSSFDLNTGNIMYTTFCSCSNACLLVNNVTANEPSNISRSVYPNPCRENCTSEFSESILSICVINNLGQHIEIPIVIEGNKVAINSALLGNGIYFMKAVLVSGKVSLQKFVAQN